LTEVLEIESSSPIAEPIYTLPFFIENISMIIISFNERFVDLRITNDSDLGFSVRGSGPYWYYFERYNIKLDYFDGENWRNIVHKSIEYGTTEDQVWLGGPFHYFPVSPSESATVRHPLTWHPFPEYDDKILFRIRKHIYLDPIHIQPGLFQTLREANEADSNSWFGIGTPRHTLTTEFYWDGQAFHPR